jgi:hypothetical protein
MPSAAGKLIKAGFVELDALTGAVRKVVVFPYNPETLVRRVDGVAGLAGGVAARVPGETVAAGVGSPTLPAPRESVSFTLTLDAADKLERGDPVALQAGLQPIIAALELLLYPAATGLTLWVSGSRRIIPVRINELVFNEQAFDAALNPIRAEVLVSLQVLKDADFPPNSKGRALWDAYYLTLQQLATEIDPGTLAALGIAGV